LTSTYDESALEDLEINPKQVERGELIAHGFSAEVFKAVWKGTDVVLKELHWKSRLPEKKADAFRKELTLLVKFRHPNLVLLIGAVTRTLPYSLVLEFCSGGT
jgi:serine/threonine-protein kinase CTR1